MKELTLKRKHERQQVGKIAPLKGAEGWYNTG